MEKENIKQFVEALKLKNYDAQTIRTHIKAVINFNQFTEQSKPSQNLLLA